MSEHKARIEWVRGAHEFSYEAYSRNHRWVFDNGASVAASAATAFLGSPDRVDPEEAYVAAISSCHMLTFLAICARKRIVVDAYEDNAVGYMEPDETGQLWVARVDLRPAIRFADSPPSPERIARIHHLSHKQCFIANSVTTEIRVSEPGP